MINDQLLRYVRQQLSLNVGREVITANLKSQGWTDSDINEVFLAIGSGATPVSAPGSSTVSTTTPNVSQAQTFQTQAGSFHPTHVKSKKILPVIIILILLCLAGGAAGYAYYTGLFISFPKLISESIDTGRVTTSANYDATISIDFSQIKSIYGDVSQLLEGVVPNKITVAAKGSFDSLDKEKMKSSMLLSVDSGSLSLGAEFRVLDHTLYGQLTKSPVDTFTFMSMLTAYENKWFSFPLKSEDGRVTDSPIGSISGLNSNVIDKITPEQRDYLYKMIRDAHLVKAVKKLSFETVGGESSYHFIFDLDREGISAYLQLLKGYINTIGKDDSVLSAFDSTSLAKELDNIKDFRGEIWIGRSDKLIHKILLNFGIQPDLTKDEQTKVNIVAIFSDYNQPVFITAPAESIPLETLISNMMADSRQKGNEAIIKASLSGMRARATLFYDAHQDSYSSFCSSKELKDDLKLIKNAGGTGFVCKTTAKKYAIGVKISESSGNWCVDSTGDSKSTATLPSSAVCPAQ